MDYWVQKTAKTCRIVFLLSSMGILFACEKNKEIPFYNTPDFTPIFTKNTANITHQIADFSFLNQAGKAVTQKNIEGKIHVANFFFTSCGSICPTMTSNLKKVSKAFENDKQIVLLSYSVTPWIDSLPKLRQYAQLHQITNPNWHLLTGNKANIYQLARKSYFAEEDIGFTKDSTDFLHTEHVILVDKSKRIRGIYNGTLRLEMSQLIQDIQLLKKEE